MNSYLKFLSFPIIAVLSACAMYQPNSTELAYQPVMPLMPVLQKSEPGAIYNRGNAGFLFEDRRAQTVGDIITVKLVENTQAQKKADTKIKKADASEIEGPSLLGLPVTYKGADLFDTNLSASRDFKAESDSKQSNSLSGQVSVMVVSVLPNGYLEIRGDKWVNINQGQEFVRISGIVRPEDIGPDNTIISTRVANARITYSGTGQMADANSRGWLARFFTSDWWPF